MTIPRLHFPHISRIFSAFCLWTLLLTLVSFNIFLRITKPMTYADGVFQIFAHPNAASAYENLAQALWSSGARTQANHELAIVAELNPVLGASTTAKEEREKTDSIYWLNIAASYPDYRDAYLQIAALSYRQGNLTQTHAYLVKALALDPNNAAINRLLAFTSKFLE